MLVDHLRCNEFGAGLRAIGSVACLYYDLNHYDEDLDNCDDYSSII